VPSFGQWQYTVDVAATAEAYARAPHGDAQRCRCSTCRNFISIRDTVLPNEFRNFLLSLGIDPLKEGEVYHRYQFVDDRSLVNSIRSFIDFYNRDRLHSSLGYQSPDEFEARCS